MLKGFFRSGETEPNFQEHASELLPKIDFPVKNPEQLYQDMVVDELMANPNLVFDNHWSSVTPRMLTLSGSVHKETGVWLDHEQLGFAHLQGRQKAATALITQRILDGDPNSEKTLQVVGLVRDELISNNQNVEYDLLCHNRLVAAVDQLASGEDPAKFKGMLDAYNQFAQTPDRIWRDTSPARAVVLEGIADYTNIATFKKSPSGQTARKMAQLERHYANVSEDDDLFNRDRVLVERLQTIIGWQYIKTLEELEAQQFSPTAANQASLLSNLCDQLKLRLPTELQQLAQELVSPDAVTSGKPSVSIASLLPNGLADITINPDGSRGRFGSKLVGAVLTAGIIGGVTNFAPAVGAITVSYTKEETPSAPSSKPIALDFSGMKVKQNTKAKPKHHLGTEDQAAAEIAPPEETESVALEPQVDELSQADELLPLEPVALEFPEDSTAEDFLIEDVNPSEGIAVPTPEQKIRQEAKDTQGRSREKLDKEFDQIAQANYATGESVAGKESHKAAQDAFKNAITYLDAQQTQRETGMTEEEKLAQQTEMYWLFTGHARVILNNPDVVIDDAYMQELKDLLTEKQTPADEAFMAAILLYWADEKNGFSALADIEQSGYTEDQLTVIQLLLAVAAFDAMPVADKAAILKNYGEQPEPTPEQQSTNDQADKDKKPNKEKDEKDRKDNGKDQEPGKDKSKDQDGIKQYNDLLDLIDDFEGGDNYNAYYGNSDNTKIKFTSMTVGEVLAWQREFVEDGSPSSAVGNYQFIQGTLRSLVDHYNISMDRKFDKALQDRLAIHLLKKRGLDAYEDREISAKEFAHRLSMEWASLPQIIVTDPDNPDPASSYYNGDGLNNAHVEKGEVLDAVEEILEDSDKPGKGHDKNDKAKEKPKNNDKQRGPKTTLEEQILEYPGVDEIVSETDTGAPLPNELREVVYYSQWDERWANKAYNWPGGDGRTISSSGCGPSSQAIVISTLSNKKVTPVDMAEWNLKHGYRVNGGTAHAALVESARAYGLEANFIDDGIEGIRTAVKNGKLVIVNGTDTDRNTPATDAGHIYVVTDIALNGDFIVSDPNSITKSLEQYDPATIANAASVAVAVGK